MTITIYHNPKCSKSRGALKLLESYTIEIKIIDYLNNPPTASELKKIIKLLKIFPRELIRSSEQIYKEKNLDRPNLSDTELIEEMVQNPILIQRPIVLSKKEAVIGRPPENVLKII